MLVRGAGKRATQAEIVTMEVLVPEGHLLRSVSAARNIDFIYASKGIPACINEKPNLRCCGVPQTQKLEQLGHTLRRNRLCPAIGCKKNCRWHRKVPQ